MSKGFRRPIQLYVKGDFTPSQVMWSDAHHPQTPYTPYRGIYATSICPPPRLHSVWGDNDTPHRSTLASTSQYYNPLETDSYLPSYETELSTRRYCFQSPLYSAVWSPPENSEVRTPPKRSSSSRATTPRTPSSAAAFNNSGNATPHHTHVYPPDVLEATINDGCSDQSSSSPHVNGGGTAASGTGSSLLADVEESYENSESPEM